MLFKAPGAQGLRGTPWRLPRLAPAPALLSHASLQPCLPRPQSAWPAAGVPPRPGPPRRVGCQAAEKEHTPGRGDAVQRQLAKLNGEVDSLAQQLEAASQAYRGDLGNAKLEKLYENAKGLYKGRVDERNALQAKLTGVPAAQAQRRVPQREVAVTDAVVKDVHFYLPPQQIERLADKLMARGFYLLTAHRQAGKSTVGYAVRQVLQKAGYRVAYIFLHRLQHPEHTADGVFKLVLDDLKVPVKPGMSCSQQLLQHQQQPGAQDLVIIIDEADAIDRLDLDEQQELMQDLREGKQLPDTAAKLGCLMIGTPKLEATLSAIAERETISPFSPLHLCYPRNARAHVLQESL